MVKVDISIVVPVYNVKEYLSQCLDSCVNQTIKNIEVIVIDDGSTDGSEKICDSYANTYSTVRVFHVTNSGVSNARNIGIEKAAGDWVMFLDADDWLELDACEFLYEKISDYADVDIISASYYEEYIRDSISFVKNRNHEEVFNKYELRQLIRKMKHLPHENEKWCATSYVPWGKLIRRSLVRNLRYVAGLSYGEDELFNVQLFLKSKKLIFIDNEVVHYRQRKSSLMHRDFSKLFENNIEYCRETYKIISNNPDIFSSQEEAVRVMVEAYINLLSTLVSANSTYIKRCKCWKDKIENEIWLTWLKKAGQKAGSKDLLGRGEKVIVWLTINKSYRFLLLIYSMIKKEKRLPMETDNLFM